MFKSFRYKIFIRSGSFFVLCHVMSCRIKLVRFISILLWLFRSAYFFNVNKKDEISTDNFNAEIELISQFLENIRHYICPIIQKNTLTRKWGIVKNRIWYIQCTNVLPYAFTWLLIFMGLQCYLNVFSLYWFWLGSNEINYYRATLKLNVD